MKPVTAKKSMRIPRACKTADTRSATRIEELKSELGLFIDPDYSLGDYWPKLDRRLCGKVPDLIARTLDALDAAYPGKKAKTTKHCKDHHDRAD
jgi:hypothetical protein